MSVTHVAGPLVVFSKLDRAIQRCAICGDVLDDMQPSCIAVFSTNSEDHGLPHFAEAHLIRVDGDNPKHFADLGDFRTEDLPDDFCLVLVENPRRIAHAV